MQSFAGEANRRLIDSAVERIRTALPDVAGQMERSDVEATVHHAIAKSESYGVKEWPDVIRYLDVMYILGFTFDEDERYPWAAPVLTAAELEGSEKMRQLTDMALEASRRAHPLE